MFSLLLLNFITHLCDLRIDAAPYQGQRGTWPSLQSCICNKQTQRMEKLVDYT